MGFGAQKLLLFPRDSKSTFANGKSLFQRCNSQMTPVGLIRFANFEIGGKKVVEN